VNDAEIIKKVKQGHIEDYALLVEKYHRQLLSFIHKITSDHTLTEDIGQDVFLSIFQSLPGFNEQAGTPFSAWLFITARNAAISAIRNRQRWRFVRSDFLEQMRDSRPVPIEKLVNDEEHQALRECLRQLDEPYRTALIRSLKGDSIDKMARLESVSTGTIKSRIHRARKKLTSLVQDYFRGEQYE
jgi:RNA polymerase sigma-70 factor, ECF subfamily